MSRPDIERWTARLEERVGTIRDGDGFVVSQEEIEGFLAYIAELEKPLKNLRTHFSKPALYRGIGDHSAQTWVAVIEETLAGGDPRYRPQPPPDPCRDGDRSGE